MDSYWAWAPGPIVVRPVYSPALVVFFGRPGVQVAVGSPFVSWVALGWGEPIVPWWGSPRYIGRPHWAGWGGPRVVNNVVINRTTVVNVTNINVYRNVNVHNAVVAVPQDAFGRRGVHDARMHDVDVRQMQPIHGRLNVKPDTSNFVIANGPGAKPPAHTLDRPVVATRRPARPERQERAPAPAVTPAVATPAPKIVPAPKPAASTTTPPTRPPFGSTGAERPRPPVPPRFDTRREPDLQRPAAPRPDSTTATPPNAPREQPDRRAAQPAPPVTQPAPTAPVRPTQPPTGQAPATPHATPRQLPGEPANRVFPGRQEPGRQEPSGQKPAAFNNSHRPQESRAAAHPDAGASPAQARRAQNGANRAEHSGSTTRTEPR